jgi:hypothetical protein
MTTRADLNRQRKDWTQSTPFAVLCCIVFVFVGIAIAPRAYAWWYGWEETTPAPTIQATQLPASRITVRDVSAPPRQEPAAQQPAPEPPTAAPAPPDDSSASGSAPVVPAPAPEPAAPVEPLPEPSEPGFVESFEAPPACSAFIGYLPGDPCYAGPPPQAPLPQPGDAGFVESFK